MAVPDSVLDLVDRFDDQLGAYRSGQYKETQLRREFLAPFFEALGWDVANKQGHAEAYKEVVHEDAIKIGGATKAPDYSWSYNFTASTGSSATTQQTALIAPTSRIWLVARAGGRRA